MYYVIRGERRKEPKSAAITFIIIIVILCWCCYTPFRETAHMAGWLAGCLSICVCARRMQSTVNVCVCVLESSSTSIHKWMHRDWSRSRATYSTFLCTDVSTDYSFNKFYFEYGAYRTIRLGRIASSWFIIFVWFQLILLESSVLRTGF